MLTLKENAEIARKNEEKMRQSNVNHFQNWLSQIKKCHEAADKVTSLTNLKDRMVSDLGWTKNVLHADDERKEDNEGRGAMTTTTTMKKTNVDEESESDDAQQVESFVDETQLTFLCKNPKLCFVAVYPTDSPYYLPNEEKTYFRDKIVTPNPMPTPGKEVDNSYPQESDLDMWTLMPKQNVRILKLNKWRHRIFEDFLPKDVTVSGNFKAVEIILYHYLVIWDLDGFEAAASTDQESGINTAMRNEDNKKTALNYLNEAMYETAMRTTSIDQKMSQLNATSSNVESKKTIRYCQSCRTIAVSPGVDCDLGDEDGFSLFVGDEEKLCNLGWQDWKPLNRIVKYDPENHQFNVIGSYKLNNQWYCPKCVAVLKPFELSMYEDADGPSFIAICDKCNLSKPFANKQQCIKAKWFINGDRILPSILRTDKGDIKHNDKYGVLCHIHEDCNSQKRSGRDDDNYNNNNLKKVKTNKLKY